MKLKQYMMMAFTLLSMIGITSCASSQEEPREPIEPTDTPQLFERPSFREIELTTTQNDLVEANNNLAFKVFSDINTNPDHSNLDNVIYSPVSLYSILSMLVNGDEGNISQTLLYALSNGQSGVSISDLNEFNAFLLNQLPEADPTTQFNINNSFWFNKNLSCIEKFKNLMSDCYKTELFFEDFSNSNNIIASINHWVENSTKGYIKNFLNSFDFNDISFNVNTNFFKGAWEEPFAEKKTVKDIFHSSKNDVYVYMMNKTSWYNATETEKEEIVRLPYGSSNFECYIFLPKKGVKIDDYVKTLTYDYFKSLAPKFQKYFINLSLPKFSVTSNIKLNGDDLKSCGLDNLFMADFNSICKDKTVNYHHGILATSFSIDESGTVASSATTTGGKLFDFTDENKMTIDRPFIFLIKEMSTNTIVYMGKIKEL